MNVMYTMDRPALLFKEYTKKGQTKPTNKKDHFLMGKFYLKHYSFMNQNVSAHIGEYLYKCKIIVCDKEVMV